MTRHIPINNKAINLTESILSVSQITSQTIDNAMNNSIKMMNQSLQMVQHLIGLCLQEKH
jgi:hypothetical protein